MCLCANFRVLTLQAHQIPHPKRKKSFGKSFFLHDECFCFGLLYSYVTMEAWCRGKSDIQTSKVGWRSQKEFRKVESVGLQ